MAQPLQFYLEMASPSSLPPPGSRPGELVRLDSNPPVRVEPLPGLASPELGSVGLFEIGGINDLAHFGIDGAVGATNNGVLPLFGEASSMGGLFSTDYVSPSAGEHVDSFVDGGDWLMGMELTCHEPRWDGVPAMTVGRESLGLSALHFLGYRSGVSLGARNPSDASRFFRTEFGETNFRRMEFLFSGDDVSRARIHQLRDRVAERVGHRYTNLDDAKEAVRAVLREEGVDLAAWRDARRASLEGDGNAGGARRLNDMHADVLEGVFLVQLLPDELPLYRSTEPFRADQPDPGGSSYWGVGSDGLTVAASYMSPGRVFTTTTLGDLRHAGVVRTDEMAVTGNALELYHWNIEGSNPDAYTAIRYDVVVPAGVASSK